PPAFLHRTRASPPPVPYTTLFRSLDDLPRARRRETPVRSERHHQKPGACRGERARQIVVVRRRRVEIVERARDQQIGVGVEILGDRKSTRLNSSHQNISYAVYCSN